MPVKVINARLRAIPRDRLVFEAVQIGEIQPFDASIDLIMEATIAVDREEIAHISKIPEVVQSMGEVVAPATKQYGTTYKNVGDWRAKVPEIRKMQWKQKPIIDYIIEANKEAVLEAVQNKFAPLSPEWRTVLFGANRENMRYAKDAKALQLSTLSTSDINTAAERKQKIWPDSSTRWKFIYVHVIIGLGDVASGTGFVGAIAKEAQQALEAGQMLTGGEGQMKWPSSLAGLDAVLRELDPHTGVKAGSKRVKIGDFEYDVADEPGYDLEVRSSILDKIQEALAIALETSVSGVEIDNDGSIIFSAVETPEEDETEQDLIAKEMEPEELVPDDPSEQDMSLDQSQLPPGQPETEMESKTVKCSNCNGTGDVVGRGGDGERAWLICSDCGGTGKREEH